MWLTFALGVADTIAGLAHDAPGPFHRASRWVERSVSGAAPEVSAGEGRLLMMCDSAARVDPGATAADMVWSGVQLGEAPLPAPAEARGLLLNIMDIDRAHEDEFNDWYDTEHLPRLASVEGVIAARRFRSEDHRPRYLATYHLTKLDVVLGAPWKEAALTPWTARIRRHRYGLIRLGFTAL